MKYKVITDETGVISDIQEIENPLTTDAFGVTNLQKEKWKTKEKDWGVTVHWITQSSLPHDDVRKLTLNTKKTEVVLLPQAEIDAIDEQDALTSRINTLNWQFPDRNIRVTLPKNKVKAGGIYHQAGLVNDLLIEKAPFIPDNDINGNVIIYLKEIKPTDLIALQTNNETIESLDDSPF